MIKTKIFYLYDSIQAKIVSYQREGLRNNLNFIFISKTTVNPMYS